MNDGNNYIEILDTPEGWARLIDELKEISAGHIVDLVGIRTQDKPISTGSRFADYASLFDFNSSYAMNSDAWKADGSRTFRLKAIDSESILDNHDGVMDNDLLEVLNDKENE